MDRFLARHRAPPGAAVMTAVLCAVADEGSRDRLIGQNAANGCRSSDPQNRHSKGRFTQLC
ncbi:hypothetical protein CJO79_20465 (plasmid) [Ralstonia solanacearum]|nr:hypothetical protein CJO76_20495 [Ralstonia solanacearum]AXV93348.1 hypothetical protein CJO79_20465 [Ralstonia solanacearum]AXW21379.1 hypothetical protein CJO85_20555 [Ralstonia solanacearum]AXW78246.1 hypothetical protein CJO97_20470 [Ralstonia solanacearum]